VPHGFDFCHGIGFQFEMDPFCANTDSRNSRKIKLGRSVAEVWFQTRNLECRHAPLGRLLVKV
jgi:hypothetical protein